MSRRTYPLVAAFLILGLATCQSIDNIDVEAGGQTVIPQRSIIDEVIGQLAFTGFDSFDIAQSQEFQNQGYTKDQVDSVRLKRFTLSITSPNDGTFDFVDSIAFYAESEGLPRVLIAELDPVPTGQGELELELATNVELQPYVVAPTMTIATEASGRRPAQETTIDARVVLDVDIAVTGACN